MKKVDETRPISARIPIELYEIIEAKLKDAWAKGKKIPLKTKGKFRDPRLSDILIDMLADAVIKDEQSGEYVEDFWDRLAIALTEKGDLKVRSLGVEDCNRIQDLARSYGFESNIRSSACYIFFYKKFGKKGMRELTCSDFEETFTEHKNREIERD